jgi:hypothetical protein
MEKCQKKQNEGGQEDNSRENIEKHMKNEENNGIGKKGGKAWKGHQEENIGIKRGLCGQNEKGGRDNGTRTRRARRRRRKSIRKSEQH